MEPCVNMKNHNKPIQSYKLIVANTERRETRRGRGKNLPGGRRMKRIIKAGVNKYLVN